MTPCAATRASLPTGCCNKSPLPIRPPRQRGRSSSAPAAVTSSRVANRDPRMYEEPVGSTDRRAGPYCDTIAL